MNKKIIFLSGPTASGKTKFLKTLYQYLPIRVISTDSAAVFKYMNIGTSKPNQFDLSIVPHSLIDIRDPTENYSIQNFYFDAINEIRISQKENRIPLFVGGSMLYFNILTNGLNVLPKKNDNLRKKLFYSYKKYGCLFLYQKLQSLNLEVSRKIHCNDYIRIIRAIEICYFYKNNKNVKKIKKIDLLKSYKIYRFVINKFEKNILNLRIKKRFFNMLKLGLEEEIYSLYNRGDLNLNSQSIQCIGYRQMWKYFLGIIKYEDMIYETIIATKRLIKHQLTWLKKWKNVIFLNGEPKNYLYKILNKFNFL